ncbi:MAG: hypothetical protein HY748_10185 [Elusimicrobia bacterium]|nr:hypothetical protein [Elusimicrobiota bacterium]
MTKSRRGSVMVHVLITSVIMGLLAAGMMSIVLMQYRLIHREHYGSRGKKYDEQAVSLLITYWSANADLYNGQPAYCLSFTPGSGVAYSCGGTAGLCSCTCTPNPPGFYPEVVAQIVGGSCEVTARFEQAQP